MKIPIPRWLSKPVYLEWKEYHARVALINAFSFQQHQSRCQSRSAATLLKTF
ncbi:hypothetical protein HYS47_00460 [Candidatus Woesearchaeota archaeon]|nr:hypothetical protein [Candidatus Woesearchaeota archaeon]